VLSKWQSRESSGPKEPYPVWNCQGGLIKKPQERRIGACHHHKLGIGCRHEMTSAFMDKTVNVLDRFIVGDVMDADAENVSGDHDGGGL